MKDEGKAIVGELTLKDVAQIIAKARVYLYYLRRCADRAFQQLQFMTGSDSDGYPYEQTVSVYRRKEGVSDWLNDHEWHFVVGYEQVQSGDFDYISTVRHDNNTAYKTRRPGPPIDVKFRLMNYWHPYQTPKQLGLAGDDLPQIKADHRSPEVRYQFLGQLGQRRSECRDHLQDVVLQRPGCAAATKTARILPNLD